MMGEGTILNYLDVMTGGSLSNGTLFAMSITPYINASIIVQLLTVAIPALERLSKEGEEGRKKINKITKYVALGIGLFQAIAFYIGLRNTVNETTHKSAVLYTEGFDGVIAAITIVACFVAGASLIIWLGDQISQKGIGNGISMILFAGIIIKSSRYGYQSDQADLGSSAELVLRTADTRYLCIDDCIRNTDDKRRKTYSRSVCKKE